MTECLAALPMELVLCFVAYRNGALPDVGGLMCQAATFLDAVSVLEMEFARIEREEDEKQKAK